LWFNPFFNAPEVCPFDTSLWSIGFYILLAHQLTLSFLANQSCNQITYMSVSIKPLADRVLVRPAAAEERTASGIIIPDSAKEKPQKGEIVAIGEGKTAENGTIVKPQVKVGDNVLYGKYAGTEITVDGKDYLIMRESDIFAIL